MGQDRLERTDEQEAGTGTRRQESEGERGRSKQKVGDSRRGKVGGEEYKSCSIGWVCAEAWEVLRGRSGIHTGGGRYDPFWDV